MIPSRKLPKVKDPVKLIKGIFSRLRGKYTSVELQHQTMELWANLDSPEKTGAKKKRKL